MVVSNVERVVISQENVPAVSLFFPLTLCILETQKCVLWQTVNKTVVKNVYRKNNFLISQPKHMLGYSKELSQ